MTLTIWLMLAIAGILALPLSIFIGSRSKRPDDYRVGVAWYTFMILILVFSFLLEVVSPQIITVKEGTSYLKYDTDSQRALFSYKGHKVAFFDTYIDNRTDEVLVLYPVYYSKDDSDIEDLEDGVTIIVGHSFKDVPHTPQLCFYVPDHIYIKGSKECKWALETLEDVIRERSNEDLFEQLNEPF